MADPDVNNVVLLANFIGTDGDTSYTPEIGGAITFNADTRLEDTVTQFGNTMLYADGTDDYATWGAAADVEFLHDKSADYTVEFFVRRPTIASDGYVFTTRGTSHGVIFAIYSDGSCNFSIYNSVGDIAYAQSASGVFSAATTYYVKITYSAVDGVKVRVDGVIVASDSSVGTTSGTPANYALTIGRAAHSSFRQCEIYIGPLRITEGEALDDSDVPVAIFPSTVTFTGYVSLPGPLGSPAIRVVNDFSSLITDSRAFYVMELTGSPTLRIPIKSWQATIQTDRASYLQAVIPAADDWSDDLSARLGESEFYVSRQTFIDGNEWLSELARANFETSSYAKGPRNTTITISGYADASTASASPSTRTLTGLRSITTSSTGTMRVRCDIDWFLRPGDTAVADGDSFTVHYINYYVPESGDIYMDVGDRQ